MPGRNFSKASEIRKKRAVPELRKKLGRPELRKELLCRLAEERELKNNARSIEKLIKENKLKKNKTGEFKFNYYSAKSDAAKIKLENELAKMLRHIDSEIPRIEKKLQTNFLKTKSNSHIYFTDDGEADESNDSILEDPTSHEESSLDSISSDTYAIYKPDSAIGPSNNEKIIFEDYVKILKEKRKEISEKISKIKQE